ncbi:MAG TPA: M24 family metallopeptidase [Vicinamibacterales bacterium]|nr:M24 family metallopeptidase [Vicinamibacterales bacterium]
MIRRLLSLALTIGAAAMFAAEIPAGAQEARRRWAQMCEIRRDKFDYILREAMRENDIDMWIVMMREGHYDPLYDDLGRGYPGRVGYYVFTDRRPAPAAARAEAGPSRFPARIERAALGISGPLLEGCGAYDIVTSSFDLRAFVAERAPRRIGVNMSEAIGAADGLSHTAYLELARTLGEPWASRLVSAEKLVSDFRSRRVASEIAAFGEAAQISRLLAERALSNEVIAPGRTTLEDVAWWLQDRLLERGLTSAFDMPSVYVTGPKGIEAVSNRRVIRRGDLLMIDWGVCLMNFCTDMKRIAYVLREGEDRVPAGLQRAFDQAVKAREIVRRTILPGRRADETLALVNRRLEEAGFAVMEAFDQPSATPRTDVIVGCHSVGNLGHDVGPSIAWFTPRQLTFAIRPTNLLSIELFAWTPAPEWQGRKVRIPLEDDAMVTERGVEWIAPPGDRILLIG